jgi:hypothetical protein
MIAFVKVVTPQQYGAWLEYQRNAIATANDSVSALRAILTKNGNL